MATGDASSPVRFGGGQVGTTNRELFLDVFGGEVINAFNVELKFGDKITSKTVGGGAKSWKFPKTWKATAEYHTPGVELLGTDIETSEVIITADDFLVSHTGISDIDSVLSHFDVRSEFSSQMGAELARVHELNVARQLTLTSRESADGPFPGGASISSDTLASTSGVFNGANWIAALRDVQKNFFVKNVPQSAPKYVVVNWDIFDAIKYATDANGNYLVLNRDFHGSEGANAGGISGNSDMMTIDGITVIRSGNLPFGFGVSGAADESADANVYSKYRGDWELTCGVAWSPMAVGECKVSGIEFESTRDVRRREDFMVAAMLTGLGSLRKECAIELKTATAAST
jgi:hypothetical protein